jgi:hypothetical protein
MSEFEVIVYTGDGKVFLAFQSAKFDIERGGVKFKLPKHCKAY